VIRIVLVRFLTSFRTGAPQEANFDVSDSVLVARYAIKCFRYVFPSADQHKLTSDLGKTKP
jgi:hypothetical protein